MKNFDTPHFRMNVHDTGLVEFKIKKDIALTAEDVWHSQELSVNHLPGRKLYVLTEAEGEFKPTPDARRAGASSRYASHVNAHALYSRNLTLKILGNLFIRINKPVVPTRFFDERESALEWLRNRMNA